MIFFFSSIYQREIERGWDDIKETAGIVQAEIKTKFDDEIMKLHLIETIFKQRAESGEALETAADFLHDEKVYSSTVFSRVDAIFFDKMISISNSNEKYKPYIDFDGAFERGEGMTERYKDIVTGNDCISYIHLCNDDGGDRFAIVGVIDLNRLYEFFSPSTYGENVNICIIDAHDGNYILDSWHSDLGNAYELEERERLRGYENVDFKNDIKELKSGHIAFTSKSTGEPLCMYYTPADMFGWEIAIFVDGNILFENAYHAVNLMLMVGISNVIFITLYFVWNIHIIGKLEKSNNEIEAQRKILSNFTYKDALTSMYNRRRFMDDIDKFNQKGMFDVGVIYLDLNGLKNVNDTQSHENGDAYLCAASDAILSIFKENSYRIGGDEFVIFAEGFSEDDFADNVALLKRKMSDKGVDISIGVVWKSGCCCLDDVIKEAERLMYIEKTKHYQEFGRGKIPDTEN